jgi:hypothetical protein
VSGVALQVRVIEAVVDHHKISELLGLLLFKVQHLPWHVPGLAALADGSCIAEQRAVADFGPSNRRSKVGLDEDRKVPVVSQFMAQKENAVQQQDGIGGRNFLFCVDFGIGAEIEDSPPKQAGTVGTERNKQAVDHRRIVERTPEVALRGVIAPPTFVCPHCGAAMRIVEIFARGEPIRAPPTLRAAA